MRLLACGLLSLFASSCQCGVDRIVDRPRPMCSEELCNGLDDDCDGEVDDGFGPVSCGVGACAVEVQGCVNGEPQTCTPGAPGVESCNGVDDDCDGAIDEDQGTVRCGVGACVVEVPACSELCVPADPTVETCNGVDDDCDGEVDEGACAAPTVMCPASQAILLGDTVTLTATTVAGSSPIASTTWTVSAAPTGSTAQPATPAMASTTFAPDVGGRTTLQFCATDDGGRQACCTSSVDTSECRSPPTPPVSTACGTSWDGRPIVQFAAVPSGLTYQLTRAGDATVLASAAAGSNWLRPSQRIDPGGPVPGATVRLAVSACREEDPACCSAPTPIDVAVVEACSAPVRPTSANVVFSEYVVNGEGACPSSDCATHDTCQAGESIELTNLSNCPVALDGFHFAYRNNSASSASLRWMNFGPGDVIPPRGVYVAIRNKQYAPTCSAALPAQSTGLYGLKISSLDMNGPNLCNGWFNNTGGGMSELQVAPGTIPTNGMPSFTVSAAIARIAPYLATGTACDSVGFDAVDSCGSVVGGSQPGAALSPNQLGRLWHPCDAVVNAVPACVRD